MSEFINALLSFTLYYPLFMAYLWMIGGIYYYFHWERRQAPVDQPPVLPSYPRVAIVVPCHNEAHNIRDTVESLLKVNYPDYEIVLVNDGSTDETQDIIEGLATIHDNIRVVRFPRNQGKAMALSMGAMVTPCEYIVAIDGDALLDSHAVTWIMYHLLTGNRVGAVTGNPRIRTRSTLLGKIQVGEFSSIIGMLKRCQRIYGRVFTVSGVVSGFRKTALHRVGYWDLDMVTEDIDVSWKLQLDHWDIRYEPNALCWILMPETLRGLWRQRLRWAQGGVQVLFKYFGNLLSWRKRRMWMVYLELLLSMSWAYIMFTIIFLWLLEQVVTLPGGVHIPSLIPGWAGVVLAFTCLLQFLVSLVIDSRYEPNISRYYYWMIWYPLLYWVLNAATAVVALPVALMRKKSARGLWQSPDRGIRPEYHRGES
jgi:biofilm PGA synthesis N-glycosyltransferase PgaC